MQAMLRLFKSLQGGYDTIYDDFGSEKLKYDHYASEAALTAPDGYSDMVLSLYRLFAGIIMMNLLIALMNARCVRGFFNVNEGLEGLGLGRVYFVHT